MSMLAFSGPGTPPLGRTTPPRDGEVAVLRAGKKSYAGPGRCESPRRRGARARAAREVRRGLGFSADPRMGSAVRRWGERLRRSAGGQLSFDRVMTSMRDSQIGIPRLLQVRAGVPLLSGVLGPRTLATD